MTDSKLADGQPNLAFWFVLAGVLIHAGMLCTYRMLPNGNVIASFFILAAIMVSAWGIFRARRAATWQTGAVEGLLWLILATGLADLPWGANLVKRLLGNPAGIVVVLFAIVVSAGLATAIRFAGPRARYAVLGVLMAISAGRNYMDITRYPDREFDVIQFNRVSGERLLRGENPFHGPIPLNIPHDVLLQIYDPSVIEGQNFLYGYAYPPVALLSGFLGHWLAGDFRIFLLASFLVISMLLYRLLPTRTGLLAAAAVLLGPASRSLLYFGWTEATCSFYLVLALSCYLWRPGMAPYVFGLFLSSKQTLPLLFPGLWMFLRQHPPPGGTIRWMAKCVGIAVLIVMPFVAMGPGDFFKSQILVHIKQPTRLDSVSFGPMLFGTAEPGKTIAGLLSLCLYAGTVVAGYLAGVPRQGLGMWCGWSSLSFMMYFILNKQGFSNYYFLCWIFLLVGAVIWRRDAATAPAPAPVN